MRREEEEPPRADLPRVPWWRKVPLPPPPGTPTIDPDAPFGVSDSDPWPWRPAA